MNWKSSSLYSILAIGKNEMLSPLILKSNCECFYFIHLVTQDFSHFACISDELNTYSYILILNSFHFQTLRRTHWNAATESMVDSSFFWGYLITQIPGGFLASIVPANRIFGLAICTSAVLNMTIPGAMSLDNVSVLVIIRVIQGLVEVMICSE